MSWLGLAARAANAAARSSISSTLRCGARSTCRTSRRGWPRPACWPRPSTPEEFQQRVETEIALYTKIAEANGIKVVIGPCVSPRPDWRSERLDFATHFSGELTMKILYFDDFKLGVLKGDTVVDVSAVVQGHPAYRPARSDQRPDRALRRVPRRSSRRRPRSGNGVAARRRAHPPAAAEARQHRLHGGQLHGGRHAHRAGADQRLPQVAQRDHRPRRHHGAARRAGHDLRGRGRAGGGHRQARHQRARPPTR